MLTFFILSASFYFLSVQSGVLYFNYPLIYPITVVLIVLIPSFLIEGLRRNSKFIMFGLYFEKHCLRNLTKIIVISLSSFLFLITFLLILGAKVSFLRYFEMTSILLITAQLFLLAFHEEILFRGIIFQSLIERFGEVTSTITLSIVFTFVHAFNPEVTVLGLVNIFIMSIALSVIYLKTLSIIHITLFHFFWNVFQALILGWNVSGYPFYYSITFFDASNVNTLFSGGKFGIEDSLLVLIVMLPSIWFFQKYLKQTPFLSSLLYKRDYVQAINSRKSLR